MSLLLVLVAFGTYRVLAVPLIEPAARRFRSGKNALAAVDIEAFNARQVAELLPLFPEGSWELENPGIIYTGRGKLLFKDYKNLGDGLIEMNPFTMIFYPSSPDLSPEERTRRAVVIETENGAKLKFDRPLNLRRAEAGNLIGASLEGKVLIRSDNREPGEHDDLRVETSDVTLSEKLVSTDAEVVFRMGENHGRGRQLRIELESDGEDAAPSRGPQVAGISKFSLLRDVQMSLRIAVDDALRTSDEPKSSAPQAAAPVTISCEGPFQFDMQQYLIQFEDQVLVERANVEGAPDRLTCQQLLLFLTTVGEDGIPMADPEARGKGKSIASQKLVAKRIEARGPHVVLDAHSSGAHAEGELLQYDLLTKTVTLQGRQGALIRRDRSEIVALEILYRPLEGRAIGRFYAHGKGHLTAELSEGNVRSVAANWSDELRVYPDPNRPDTLVMAMRGDGHIEARGLGSLDGQKIYAWVSEKQPVNQIVAASQTMNQPRQDETAGTNRFQPEKLLAIGDVRIDAARLDASIQRLEMWFTSLPPSPVTVDAAPPIDRHVGRAVGSVHRSMRPVIAVSYNPQAMNRHHFDNLLSPTSRNATQIALRQTSPHVATPAVLVAMQQGPVPAGQPASQSLPTSKMRLTGGKLQAEVILRGSEATLAQLVVERDVRLTERRAGADERPSLYVRCDHLFLKQPTPTQSLLTLTGEPAHVEAGGMELDGGQIRLDRGQNRLWIDGPGAMVIEGRDDETGPLSGGGAMRVVWSGRMDFDGQAAIVSQDVVARSETQTLSTEWMQVRLDRRVDFADAGDDEQPEVATVDCRGGVLLESRKFTEGQPSSITTLQVERVLLDQRSGDVDCTGPGEVTSVRSGSSGQTGRLTGLRRAAPDPRTQPQANDDNNELSYLHVRFLRSLTGNLNRRHMSFNEYVRTVYGPIPTWESTIDIDETAQLGESVVLMTCDQLNLSEVPGIDRETRFMELEALGNPAVEGLLYMARGHRITYNQAKDVLTLEGNSRRGAQLDMRQDVGKPLQHTEASLIRYYPSTGESEVNGVQSLDILQTPK